MAVLFSDGFESGDFSAWSSTTTTSGETIMVGGSYAHSGNYGARFTTNGDGGYEYALVRHSPSSPLSALYMRAYVKVVQHGIVEDDDRFAFICYRGGTNLLAFLGWRKVSGNILWHLITRHGTGWATTSSPAVSCNADEWYCIELYWEKSSSATVRAWVNGQNILTLTERDTDDYGDCTSITFGCAEVINCGATAILGDCVIIADTYIGPESTLVQVSDSIGLGDVALCNKAVALSDAFVLADFSCGDKLFLLSDAAGLSELASVLKSVKVTDALMLNDYASMPLHASRVLEAIGLADDIAVFKVLQVSEAVALAEAVDSGVGGASKTRLFLVIGDLAVQLTGE